MIHESDLVCRQSTWMDRRTFTILCHLLRSTASLTLAEIINVEEMVTMFLYVLAHDVKNRVIQIDFVRSGEIVSYHFNLVLLAMIWLHDEFLKKPHPVTNTCTDPWWRCFEVHLFDVIHMSRIRKSYYLFAVRFTLQNYFESLDRTYIKVNVS